MELLTFEVSKLKIVEFIILGIGLLALVILVRKLITYFWIDSKGYASITRILPILELSIGLVFLIWVLHVIFQGQPTYFLVGFSSILAIIVWAARFAIKDIIGGAILKAEENYLISDRIRLGDIEGWITKIGLRSLHITTDDGQQLRIPYSLITGDLLWKTTSSAVSAVYTFKLDIPKSENLPTIIEKIRRCVLNSVWSSVVKEPIIKYRSENPDYYIVEVTIHAITNDYFPNIENNVRQLIPTK